MKEVEINIENKLRDMRRKCELSQEELADALGISRQSVIALEQGKYMPSLPLAVLMCQYFDTAFEDIFNFGKEIDSFFDTDKHGESHIKIISNTNNLSRSVGAGKEQIMPSEVEPWRPFREVVSLRDAMDRLFEDSIVPPMKGQGGMPKIDIKETKDTIEVKAELPGVKEEDVEVEITENVMTISGEKKEEKVEEKEGYSYKESQAGSFQRSFSLPSEVKAEKAEASMENGVLKISVPKILPKKAQKVIVKKKTSK